MASLDHYEIFFCIWTCSFFPIATPSSQSRQMQSAPSFGIFSIFRESLPGTYIRARRGTKGRTASRELISRIWRFFKAPKHVGIVRLSVFVLENISLKNERRCNRKRWKKKLRSVIYLNFEKSLFKLNNTQEEVGSTSCTLNIVNNTKFVHFN